MKSAYRQLYYIKIRLQTVSVAGFSVPVAGFNTILLNITKITQYYIE